VNEIETFVENYRVGDRSRLAFAWNGKHADGFVDENQTFRAQVVKYVCERPGSASPDLLSDLLRAESQWAREAWGAPHGYAGLAGLVLTRGGVGSLDTFLDCYATSFDTFGACHALQIDAATLTVLRNEVALLLSEATEPAVKRRLEGARDLFEKLSQGTARDGWVVVAPGTPVANVRIVSRPGLSLRRLLAGVRQFLSGRR
jgi:hypothetical protein